MKNIKDWFFYESELYKSSYHMICGIDEAGRGPLAGPVFAAAVILKGNFFIYGLNDSKKLTPKKRDELYEKIVNEATAFGVASATETEIEKYNILNATFLAMQRAVEALPVVPDFILVDGPRIPEFSVNSKGIIKGDTLSASIAAASILAKVTRDRLMLKLHDKYPEYHFDKHKGYGTALHIEMIRRYGPSEIHRKSFLGRILGSGAS